MRREPTPGAEVARCVRQAACLVKAVIALAAPADVGARDAVEIASALGELAKLVDASVLRYAQAVGSDPVGTLAGASGTATGAARWRIRAAELVLAGPIGEEFSDGRLSLEQAAAIAPAAGAAPEQTGALIERAKAGASIRELRAAAARAMRAHRSEDQQAARERDSHARRYCRAWAVDGGVRVDAYLDPVDGARLLAAIDKETEAVFSQAWSSGAREPRERFAADALVTLVCGSARTRAHLVLRVDAAALRRGQVHQGEVCEIDGVGPVSMDALRSLLGDAVDTVVVRDGVDIKSVTSTTRVVPQRLRVVLSERDRCCVVPGCPASERLEIHHWRLEYSRHGPTELDNCCRVCSVHHRMVTKHGWKIVGGPGRWKWIPP